MGFPLLIALAFFAWWLFRTKSEGDSIASTPATGSVSTGTPTVVASNAAAQNGPSDYLTDVTNTGDVAATSTDTP